MRIGIDARFYGVAIQGLGRYCEQLVKQVAGLDRRNQYIVFVLRGHRFPSLPENMQVVECEYHWYGLAEQFLWPFLLYRYRLDLMHFTSFNVPVLYRKPFILTLHDLILMHYPSAHASTLPPLLFKIKQALYRTIIKSAGRRARHIIAVSKYTAADVQKTLRVRTPMSVIYLGADLPENSGETPSDGFSVPQGPYLLYVGNAYPHKNLEFLIQCFDRWHQRQPEYSLVLAGRTDYFYERLQEKFRDVQGLYWFGSATDVDLRELYRHAHAYTIPSLYEGFGIPPLEAMHYGVPVMASNASCIPEILGDAAYYFDPTNVDAASSALTAITQDQHLREQLHQRGILQAQKYSWKRMGAQVIELYAEVEKQYTSTKKQTLNAASQKKNTG